MAALQNKIDFALVFTVRHANPNGDPLNGNRPRTDYEGLGEVSDVCLKRKIRNRLQDTNEAIFVQSDDRRSDEFRGLKERFNARENIKKTKDREEQAKLACETWLDVRAFGQVFAFGKKKDGENAVSIGIRGPVSIHSAYSQNPVDVTSIQITKSVNLETNKEDPDKKATDTMGMKHQVDYGVYVTYGSINCQLAERTGFSQEDADKIKEALRTLFINDSSSARPDGSMEVVKLIWWEHNCPSGQYSSTKVHRSVQVTDLGRGTLPEVSVDNLEDLSPEILNGE